jgi:signal transduction histidine kinase
MRSGKRSVRVKIFVLLVAPVVSVIGLWAFAASLTLGDARKELRTTGVAQKLAIPIGAVQGLLGPESLLSVVSMGTHGRADAGRLAGVRSRTDAAVAALRATVNTGPVRAATTPALRREIDGMFRALAGLGDIRAAVDSGAESRLGVISSYGQLADTVSQVQDDIGVAVVVDPTTLYDAQPLYAEARGGDLLTREQALVLGALSSGARSLDTAESIAFGQFVALRRFEMEKVAARPNATLGGGLQTVLGTDDYQGLSATEDHILATPAGSPLPPDAPRLQSTGDAVKAQYQKIAQAMGNVLIDRISKSARPALFRLALAGGVGLLALALSLLLSIRLGRRLTRELTGLQDAAHTLADERLPRVIDRLRNDEPVDVDAEAPPLRIGETAEVARVGEAFTTVQRTAIEAAIGQANLRRGVRQVFLNLARRSQSLLHRQLTMLDAMERKTTDPDALDELFALDHLTTRMRRHAEGLIILSGAQPARAWSRPVRAVDVVRAAIAEVEGYTRVRVHAVSEASFVGSAVADLTHLLAELIENAANFSPPHTQVLVRAETVGNGFVVEIEDAGLGMTPEQVDAVNERLAQPPDFDLADTDRLGLFVVAQLAARQRVRVTLRQSPYGGTTAIVWIPAELVVREELPAGSAPTELNGRGWRSAVPAVAAVEPAAPVAQPVAAPWLAVEPPAVQGPVLSGRHRRIAGFLQRTRELQADESRGRPADGELWGSVGFDLWATRDAQSPVVQPRVVEAPVVQSPAVQAAPVRPAAVQQPAPSGGTYAGLPRRIRNASLAPQLRDPSTPEPVAPARPVEVGPAAGDDRSPEQARALMASLQSGWERGRIDAEALPDEDGETR